MYYEYLRLYYFIEVYSYYYLHPVHKMVLKSSPIFALFNKNCRYFVLIMLQLKHLRNSSFFTPFFLNFIELKKSEIEF